MNVLLLRLAGPMQSWGVQSRFKERDTGLEPSKSGVVGLLCAAVGLPREADIRHLAALTMGVRVDRQGSVMRDYHTAKDVRLAKAKSSSEVRDSVSNRYYLADASFLVGLAGEDLTLLTDLHEALCDPHWPLFLGRKAFVPGEPIWLEKGLLSDASLTDTLKTWPWQGRRRDLNNYPPRLRLVLEDKNGSEIRPDQPLSFAERRFAPRYVSTIWHTMEEKLCTYQD